MLIDDDDDEDDKDNYDCELSVIFFLTWQCISSWPIFFSGAINFFHQINLDSISLLTHSLLVSSFLTKKYKILFFIKFYFLSIHFIHDNHSQVWHISLFQHLETEFHNYLKEKVCFSQYLILRKTFLSIAIFILCT